MSLRRSLRRATVAAVLLIAAAWLASAVVHDDGSSTERDTPNTSDARGLAGRRSQHGPRARSRARPVDEERDVAPLTGSDVTPLDIAADVSKATKSATGVVPEPAPEVRVEFGSDPTVLGFALGASPDRDPATGAAALVSPGKPPEIALAAFVARGAAAVSRVAELVGERKPQLEEGVPVSLTGRVVEAAGGGPIVGARVVVSSAFYVRTYFYDHHLREVARVETDADGWYKIERLNIDPAHFGAGGRLYVTVTAEGHAPALGIQVADVSPGVANRVPNVALLRATQTLRARVTDMWQGLPVVGARVIATGAVNPIEYPKDERPALFVGAPTTTTDSDGRFVLDGLGGGVQTVSVHGGDDCVGVAVVTLPHDGEFAMRTRQIRGRIEGTTLDERGDSVALVTVEGGENSTHSFADGRFVLENFRGDVVTIRFTHPDYAPVAVQSFNGAAGLVVRMERPRPTIVLDVRDRDTSAPVKRVQLKWTFDDSSERPAATSPEHLAVDGKHAVRVPNGALTVTVFADGRLGEDVSLAHRVDGEIVSVRLSSLLFDFSIDK